VLDQAIAQPSADQETYIRLIRACFKGKQIDKALDVTRAALVRFPDEHRLYELQGYIFLQTRNFTNSVAAFAQAEKIITRSKSQPLLKTFYLHAAEANQRAGDLERAAELLRTGYAFEDDIIEQFMMSAFEFDSAPGQVEAALEVLDKISDLLPREPGTYATFGLLAMRAENYPASLSMFEQARELALEAGEEDEALDAQFYFWLGSAAERNRQYDKAEEYFLQAIRLQPDHADAHNYLAYMNAERGVRLDAAMDHVAVALAVEPENPAYIDTRGWIYYRLGDYTNALADIARAFELMPNDPTIADHLGDIYMKLDNHEEARTYWEKSLNFEPANTNIVIKLQRFQNDDQASEAELNTDAGSAGPEVERLPALDPALRE